MAYYTKEQIMKARQMDLLTYLQYYEPGELVRLPGNQYCTRQHDSLKISNGKWYWWSRGLGGRSALDYLVRVRVIPFTDAVSILLGESKAGMPDFSSNTEDLSSRKLHLPDENTDADIIVRYLTGRGIDREIIEACIRNRLLYESKRYHSCIFWCIQPQASLLNVCLQDA